MSDRLTVHFDDMLHTFRKVTRPDAPNAVEDDGDVAIYTVRESMRTYGVEFQFREPVQLNIQSCEGFSVTIDRSDGLRCRILQTMLGEDQLFDTFMKDLMELIGVCQERFPRIFKKHKLIASQQCGAFSLQGTSTGALRLRLRGRLVRVKELTGSGRTIAHAAVNPAPRVRGTGCL